MRWPSCSPAPQLTAILLQPLSRVVGRPFEWFFGAEGLLGRANLGRDRARTGLTIGALIIALSAVVTLGVVASSAGATADRWVNSVLPGGYAIRFGLPVDIDTFQPQLEATTGTAAVTPIADFPAVVSHGRRGAAGGIGGRHRSHRLLGQGIADLRQRPRAAAFQALQDGGAILVSDPIARRDNLGIGSTVELAKPGADAHTFTVAGIIAYSLPSRSADGALLISLADARELFGANSAEVWAFVKQPGVTDAAFHEALAQQAKAYAAELLTAPGLSSDLERSLDRVIGLFDVLALLAVVIAGAGDREHAGGERAGAGARDRDPALARHDHRAGAGDGCGGGLDHGRHRRHRAVITGVLMSAAVVGGTASRDFGAGLSIPWPLLISVVLLGTGVAALAGLYPARIAARIPIVRTIAHHE